MKLYEASVKTNIDEAVKRRRRPGGHSTAQLSLADLMLHSFTFARKVAAIECRL